MAGATALAARLLVLHAFGGLHGAGSYDDGVYYAAGTALANGHLPYRDFFFIQPPGIAVALAPFGLLARLIGDANGFAAARVVFIVIGATNVALIALALRRFGVIAMLTGGLYSALTYPSLYADRSTLLEPLATLGIAGALAALGGEAPLRADRRGIAARLLAGAGLGFAVSVKIWYIVPVLLIIGWAMRTVRTRRQRLQLLAGSGGALLVLYGPFFLADPAGMWRQVVLDQLGRPRQHGSITHRITAVLHLPLVIARVPTVVLVGVMLAVLVVLGVAACSDRRGRLFVVLTVANAAVVLASPSFFIYYSAFVIAPLALMIGAGAGQLVRRAGGGWGRRAAGAGAVALVLLLCLSGWRGMHLGRVNPLNSPLPTGLVTAMRAVDGCITTDSPITLVLSDTLSQNLHRGCPVWVDTTGHQYDTPLLGRRPQQDAAYQEVVRDYLRSGSAVLLVRHDGLTRINLSSVTSGHVLFADGRYTLISTTR